MVHESAADDALIAQALKALAARMAGDGLPIGRPTDVAVHAYLELAEERNEVLLGYWLDSNQRLLGYDRIAYGGETTASFSVNRAARLGIAAGASAAYFLHNHPTGTAEPSPNDIKSADRIDQYMANVDILALGHFILAGTEVRNIRSGRTLDIVPASDYTGARCPNCNHRLEDPEP